VTRDGRDDDLHRLHEDERQRRERPEGGDGIADGVGLLEDPEESTREQPAGDEQQGEDGQPDGDLPAVRTLREEASVGHGL
jgi:hypothetical protein